MACPMCGETWFRDGASDNRWMGASVKEGDTVHNDYPLEMKCGSCLIIFRKESEDDEFTAVRVGEHE